MKAGDLVRFQVQMRKIKIKKKKIKNTLQNI